LFNIALKKINLSMLRILITLTLFILIACNSVPEKEINKALSIDSLTLKYANGFSVKYYDGYKIVEVKRPYMNSKSSFEYILVSDSDKLPSSLKDQRIINIPLESLVCTSTTHVPLLDYLNETDKLTGFTTTDYISSEKMRNRINNGSVSELGVDSDINLEKLIELNPDMVMAYSIGGDYGQFNKIEQMGIPVVLNAEYLEEHPLGRAEWLKFMAVFFNKEQMADSVFNKIEKKYNDLKSLADTNKKAPTILSGVVYGDTWYLPGGRNYAAKLMYDAGGNYLWSSDSTTGFLELSFEAVYEKANQADLWIGVANFENLTSIIETDTRYGQFKAFKKGAVYSSNWRKGAKGGSEYLELGYLRPDLILGDLIKIIYPDKLPNHELYFHQKLE
jgi:iron complex transport system substrate-binding protein